MRVLIVGGVFARDEEYRRSINPTPEMRLETGLRQRGVEVAVAPHSWSHSLTGIDIVHVHHLAKSVPGLAACRAVRPTPVVFTRHNEGKDPASQAGRRALAHQSDCRCFRRAVTSGGQSPAPRGAWPRCGDPERD